MNSTTKEFKDNNIKVNPYDRLSLVILEFFKSVWKDSVVEDGKEDELTKESVDEFIKFVREEFNKIESISSASKNKCRETSCLSRDDIYMSFEDFFYHGIDVFKSCCEEAGGTSIEFDKVKFGEESEEYKYKEKMVSITDEVSDGASYALDTFINVREGKQAESEVLLKSESYMSWKDIEKKYDLSLDDLKFIHNYFSSKYSKQYFNNIFW